jgi:hypothetical protein
MTSKVTHTLIEMHPSFPVSFKLYGAVNPEIPLPVLAMLKFFSMSLITSLSPRQSRKVSRVA